MGEIRKEEVQWDDEAQNTFEKTAREDGNNFLPAMGGVFHGLTLGARQVLPGFDKPDPRETKEWKQAMAALGKSKSGMLGEIAGWGAASLPSVLLGPSVPAAAASGAVLGALTPAETGKERGTNTLTGGSLGMAGQWLGNTAAGWLRSPSSTTLSPSAQQIADDFLGIGGHLSPGARKGSPRLRSLEQVLEANVLTGSGMQGMKHSNQALVNRIAADAIGEQADDLGPQVLGQAKDRIGAVFDSVRDATPVPLNRYDVGAVTRLNNQYDGLIKGGRGLTDEPLVRQFIAMTQGGGATREQLGALSTNLRTRAQSELTDVTGDRQLGLALADLQDHVEARISRSLSPDQRVAYDAARNQYRNLMTLTTGSVIDGQGDVAASRLGHLLRTRDRSGYRMGRVSNDYNVMAHAGEAFGEQLRRPSPVPRTGFSRFLLPMSGPSAGLAAAAATANPVLGGLTALGLMGAEGAFGAAYPRLVSRMMGSSPRAATATSTAAHLIPAAGLMALQGE